MKLTKKYLFLVRKRRQQERNELGDLYAKQNI